jgi:hypothetical protein
MVITAVARSGLSFAFSHVCPLHLHVYSKLSGEAL